MNHTCIKVPVMAINFSSLNYSLLFKTSKQKTTKFKAKILTPKKYI